MHLSLIFDGLEVEKKWKIGDVSVFYLTCHHFSSLHAVRGLALACCQRTRFITVTTIIDCFNIRYVDAVLFHLVYIAFKWFVKTLLLGFGWDRAKKMRSCFRPLASFTSLFYIFIKTSESSILPHKDSSVQIIGGQCNCKDNIYI